MAKRKKSVFDDPLLKAYCRPQERYFETKADRQMRQMLSDRNRESSKNSDFDAARSAGGLVVILVFLSAACGNPIALIVVVLFGAVMVAAAFGKQK